MDLAIALGQALGLAVACGLVPLLPVAIGALAALAGGTPGALDAYDDTPVVAAACVLGVAGAGGSPRATSTRIASAPSAAAPPRSSSAATRCRGPHPRRPGARRRLGLGRRSCSRAPEREGTRGGLAVTACAGLGAAVLALVPFVGYALVVGPRLVRPAPGGAGPQVRGPAVLR